MESILLVAQQIADFHPTHKFALAEVLYLKAAKEHFSKIKEINKLLLDFSLRNGMKRYSLSKIKDPSPSQEPPCPPKLQQSVIIVQEGS